MPNEAGEPSHHTVTDKMVKDSLLKVGELDLHAGMAGLHDLAHGLFCRCRIAGCNEHPRAGTLRRYRKLRDGHKGLHLRVFAKVGVLRVRNDADDLNRFARDTGVLIAHARVCRLEMLCRIYSTHKRLIDDHHQW